MYTRISDDRTSWLGIARQVLSADGHLLASGVPQSSIRHYTENHTSAWKRRGTRSAQSSSSETRVFRRQWTRLQRDVRDGRVDAVLVPHLDRLVRDVRDLEDAIGLVDATGVHFASLTGDLDLSSAEGRERARLFAWHAAESSADMSRRAAESHRRSAGSGRHVGGPRPFGWQDDRVTLHPVESTHLRRWVEMVLGGATWRAVLSDSRRRGVTGTRGAPMNSASVRQVVLNPRNCGLRMLDGRLLTDAAGLLVRGEWQTVCDDEEYFALVALKGEHPRLRAGSGTPGPQHPYLLNGIVRCGRCGCRLVVVPRAWRALDGSTTVLDSYACPAPDGGGCSGVARNARKVDAFVLAEVQRLTAEGAVAAAWHRRALHRHEATRDLEVLEEERALLLKDLARGLVEPAGAAIQLDGLDDLCTGLLDRLEAAVAHAGRCADASALCFAGTAWEDLDIDHRRRRLRDTVHDVVIHPCTTTGITFDESAVDVRLTPPG